MSDNVAGRQGNVPLGKETVPLEPEGAISPEGVGLG
jgi:hypothetical protein